MKTLKVTGLLLFLSAMSSCTTAEKSFRETDVLDRVAYKFNCPKDQLQLDVLKRKEGLGCAGSLVGVSGCGQRAVYACDDKQNWVIDDATPR